MLDDSIPPSSPTEAEILAALDAWVDSFPPPPQHMIVSLKTFLALGGDLDAIQIDPELKITQEEFEASVARARANPL